MKRGFHFHLRLLLELVIGVCLDDVSSAIDIFEKLPAV